MKWNLNMLMLVVVEKATYQAQGQIKTSYRDPCVTILSVAV